MSNPAVEPLLSRVIENHAVWLDDHFGESIHIHIDDFRANLTNTEFRKLCFDLCEAINALIDVPGFDCHSMEPVFLDMMLRKRLRHLKRVSVDQVAPKDMKVLWDGVEPLAESMCVRALKGDTAKIDQKTTTHHKGQKDQERLEELFSSVKENGYPYNDRYIILYGDDNIIMDGQHRAACLWKLDSEAEVPVQRFYFDDYVTPAAAPKWKRFAAYQLLRKCGLFLRSGVGLLTNPEQRRRRLAERREESARRAARQREEAYLMEHGAEHNEILQLLRQK